MFQKSFEEGNVFKSYFGYRQEIKMNNIYADFISPQVSRLSYSDEIIENTTTSINYHAFLIFFFY